MMKKILFLICFIQWAFPQLNVIDDMTPDQYVTDVLIGQGIAVSNITFTGDNTQIARFTNTDPVLQIGSGIVMSTGDCMSAVNAGFFDDFGNPGNPLLTATAASVPNTNINGTFDAALLDFDFVPTGNEVEFNFVFGSNEYTTFCCSNYNDVFGFYVDGPNPSGGNYVAENFAFVPGTTNPITISTVYPPGTGCGAAGQYDQYYQDNFFNPDFNCEGVLTKMSVSIPVVCGETYHFKFGVADGSDGSLNTYVFMEESSFSSNAPTLEVATISGDTTFIEGCLMDTAFFTVSRVDGTLADTFDIFTSGTAQSGIDYTAPPSQVIFAPGDTVQTFWITGFANDGIPEGMEDIIIGFTYMSECGFPITVEGTVYIDDGPELYFNSPDTLVFCNTSIDISSNPYGTFGPYSFDWEHGPTVDLHTVDIQSDTSFMVEVTDACGYVFYDTVYVTHEVLQLIASNDTTLCGGSIDLSATLQGNFPSIPSCDFNFDLFDSFGDGWSSGGTVQVWVDGVLVQEVGQFFDGWVDANDVSGQDDGSSYFESVNIPNGANVEFIATTDVWTNEGSFTVTHPDGTEVYNGPLDNFSDGETIYTTTLVCPNGAPPYEVAWTPTAMVNNPNDLITGTSNITTNTTFYINGFVNNDPTCMMMGDSVVVTMSGAGDPGLDSTHFICGQDTIIDLLDYLAGTPDNTGAWTDPNGNAINNTINMTSITNGDYTYTVGAVGCSVSAIVTFNVNRPTIDNIPFTSLTCIDDTIFSDVQVSNNIGPYTEYWSDGFIGLSPRALPTTINNTLQLWVVDSLGCFSDTVDFEISVYDSLTISLSAIDSICEGENIIIDALGGGGSSAVNGGAYNYNWSSSTGFSNGFANQNQIDITPDQSMWIYVTLDENNVCNSPEVMDSIYIEVISAPVTDLIGPNEVCANAINTYQLDVVAGTSSIQNLTWDMGDGNNLNGNPVNHAYTSSGSYDISVVFENQLGCTFDSTFENFVQVFQPIISGLDTLDMCIDGSVNLQVYFTDFFGTITETWNNGITGNGPHVVSPTVDQTYTVYGTDDNGCVSDVHEIYVEVHDSIQISLQSSSDSICEGDLVTLNVDASGGYIENNGGNYQITWLDGNGSIVGTNTANIEIPANHAETYTVLVDESHICTTPQVSASTTIYHYTATTFTISISDDTLCLGEGLTVFLQGSPASSIGNVIWDFGDDRIKTGTESIHIYVQTGVYDITVSNISPEGCASDTTIYDAITIVENPIAHFIMQDSPTTVDNPQIDFINNSENYISSYWEITFPFGDNSTFNSTDNDISYTFNNEEGNSYNVSLTVTNAYGCTDIFRNIAVVKEESSVFCPNSFTPNGDGINDVFSVETFNIRLDNYHLRIFDRWGKLLFHSINPEEAWDGLRTNGKVHPQGVYTYQLEYTLKSTQTDFQKTGTITILP